jgi:predicted AAA+ superfamily ATPase
MTDIKFIITGSNSSMLSNALNTLLSGRSLSIHLDTFSFTEFLNFKQIDHKSEFSQISNRIDISRAKDEHLKWGCFFEVFSCEDETIKKDILISYAKNIIYQDIVPRYNIRNSHIVERLFFYLLGTTTTILNYTTLAKTFELTDKTIKEYINHFEDTFMFKRIDRYHTKERVKIKSTKKLYCLDNGFLQISPKHSLNNGAILENSVFNILNQKYENITYQKEKYEIDFYVEDKLIQVSYDISDEKTRNRELNAFKYFDQTKQKLLITYDTTKNFDNIEAVKLEQFIYSEK